MDKVEESLLKGRGQTWNSVVYNYIIHTRFTPGYCVPLRVQATGLMMVCSCQLKTCTGVNGSEQLIFHYLG